MAAAETLTITRGIDDNVQVVNKRVQIVDMKVEGIDDKVRTIGSKVQSLDHKVSSVIQGELYLQYPASEYVCSQPFALLGVKETGVTIQQVAVQVTDLERSSSSNPIATAETRLDVSYRE